MEPALRYQAIQSGDIQITDAYSTDAELAHYDLQVLEDDKHHSSLSKVPLLKAELLEKRPELEGILNKSWLAKLRRESDEPDELSSWH